MLFRSQCEDGTVTQYDKRTVICDKNRTVAMLVLLNVTMEPSNLRKKKIKKPLYVTKELSHVVLELHNVKMKPSNVRKKVREPPNVRKELSHVMLELHNVRMEPLLRDKFKPLNEMLGNQTETQLWALEMTPIDFRCDNKPIQARRNKNCT